MDNANIDKEPIEWDTMYISHRIGCTWTPQKNCWLEAKVLKNFEKKQAKNENTRPSISNFIALDK